MTDKTPTAEILPPARTNDSLPADQRPSKPGRVSGKLRVALDLIVHEALEMDEAARQAGLSTRNVRKAMRRPWVVKYLREQRAMLVEELTAQNPHHLRNLRANSTNGMVKLGAARVIEELGSGGGRSSVAVNIGIAVAGYTLDLTERPAIKTIEGHPNATIAHDLNPEPEGL